MIRFIRLGVCSALSNYEIIARDEFRVPECKKQPIISPNFPPTNPAQFATKQMTNLIALEFTPDMYRWCIEFRSITCSMSYSIAN